MLKIFPDNDPRQVLRIKRFFLAAGSYAMWIGLVVFCHLQGLTYLTPGLVVGLCLVVCAFNLGLFAVLRSGWNRRFKDPSLTMVQILVATFWAMILMYYAGSARSGLMLLFLVVFVFGMFRLNFREFLMLATFALMGYGIIILLLIINRPESLNIKLETMNIIVLATVLPWFASMGSYINHLRMTISRNKAIIEKMAVVDELTGVYNRRHLFQILSREKALAERGGPVFSVAIFDVDFFKCVNDTYGHLQGDVVLKHIAHAVSQNLRTEDRIARYGGEEFVAVLAYPDVYDAVKCAERRRILVNAICFPGFPEDFRVSVSIGVTTYLPGETLEDSLARADHALYRAKSRGRNRVEHFAPPASESMTVQGGYDCKRRVCRSFEV